METISSAKNPRVLLWRSLKDKKGRDAQDAFLVEGNKMVAEALSSGLPVQAVLVRDAVTPSFPIPTYVPVYTLSETSFSAVLTCLIRCWH